jgi:predicted lysophospholipase L1 biosynthesis ABC-type transport system permease subunit
LLLGLAVGSFLLAVPVAALLSLVGVDTELMVTVAAPSAFPLMVLAAVAARGYDRLRQGMPTHNGAGPAGRQTD